MKKNFLKLLVAALSLSALIGIIMILTGNFEFRILFTALLIFIYSLAGLCSLSNYDKENLKFFSILGMTFAFIACLYSIGLVWSIFIFDIFSANSWNIIITLNILCWSSAHISLLLLIDDKNDNVYVLKRATIILALIVDTIELLTIWNYFEPSKTFKRIILVTDILIILGTITTPILSKMYKTIPNPEQNLNPPKT